MAKEEKEMSGLGEVIEGYPGIARLPEIQILPSVDPRTSEVVPCVSLNELMFLSRQAFMAGHRHLMSWEKFSNIVASWRSMEQRTRVTNVVQDVDDILSKAEKDVEKFKGRPQAKGLAGVGGLTQGDESDS